MRAAEEPTETPIPLGEVGVHEAKTASERPSSELAGLVDAHLADALAKGRTRGTIAYRRVYLGQLLMWLESRSIVRARLVTPRVLGDYLVHLTARQTTYNRKEPTKLSVKTAQGSRQTQVSSADMTFNLLR